MAEAEELRESIPEDGRGRKIYRVSEFDVVPVAAEDLLFENRLELYPEVNGKGLFRVGFKRTEIEFQAAGYIGTIPINDRVVIEVQPRVPVDNLERLMSIAEHVPVLLSPHLRNYSIANEELPALLDLFAESLIEAVATVHVNGLYQEFRSVEVDTSFPRGRILFGPTVRRIFSRGLRHRVKVVRHEQIIDVEVNQCLKYALWYLSQQYMGMQPRKGVAAILSKINRYYQDFDRVTLDSSNLFLSNPQVLDPNLLPENRSYYRNAIYLATVVIQHRSVSLRADEPGVQMVSWIVNMSDIFERYVRAALQRGFQVSSREFSVLDGNQAPPAGAKKSLFDTCSKNSATPDVVVERLGGNSHRSRYPVIVEVKYKNAKTPDRSDLEQAIVYAVSYRSDIALIVTPKIEDASSGLNFLGRIGGITVMHYAVDLAHPTPLEEEAKFVTAVMELVSVEA